MDNAINELSKKQETKQKVRIGIQGKFLTGLVVALMIGPTISAYVTSIVERLDTQIRDIVTGNFSLYLATGINLVVVSGLILTLLHFVVLKPLKKTREMMHTVAEKLDLTQRIYIRSNDEIGDMATDVNHLMETIAMSMAEVGKVSNQVAEASTMISTSTEQSNLTANEVTCTIEEIARAASDQATETAKSLESVNALGRRIEENRQLLNNMNQSIINITNLQQEGIETVGTLVEKTNESSQTAFKAQEVISTTHQSAEKITAASQMINSISEQTNLLALNAAIEAA